MSETNTVRAHIASITSKTGVNLSTHYYINAQNGLEFPSIVMLEQLCTVDNSNSATLYCKNEPCKSIENIEQHLSKSRPALQR